MWRESQYNFVGELSSRRLWFNSEIAVTACARGDYGDKMRNTRDIGFEKEKEVVKYLKKLKYKILTTNFKTNFGEIDIIARQGDTIVFVEVKYRKSSYSGTPQEAVTVKKRQKIIKSAVVYIKQNGIKDDIRFDIASVDDNKIEIINSAFVLPEYLYYL
ncbi:YraN family protein [Candidatus Endomicrobiellum agilis]|jgi:putative endonuclease|uniref:YraN family protein n=1 Tax=Candidatus Endomicrobiellum agilis TaxID=3238957 RepID=UPI00283DD55E|nr:YraN family protein [Endomicrobium sp.]MDR3092307.1 YraN family protein [Endomicrobium sp.]